MDVYNAATGENRVEWLHVIQENTFPWQPGRRYLSVEFIKEGRAAYYDALRLYCQCLKNNTWPSWDDSSPYNGWTLIEPKPWMLKKGGFEWMIGKEAA
jgi:hypothetical protein